MTKKIGQSKRMFVEDDLVANKEKELKDEIIGEVIDDLQFDKVKLQEFNMGMIDHIYLMEKTYDKALKEGKAQSKREELKEYLIKEKDFLEKVFSFRINELYRDHQIIQIPSSEHLIGERIKEIDELLSSIDNLGVENNSQEKPLDELSSEGVENSVDSNRITPDTRKGCGNRFMDKRNKVRICCYPFLCPNCSPKKKGLCKEYGYHVIGCDCNREKPIIKNDNIIEGLLK